MARSAQSRFSSSCRLLMAALFAAAVFTTSAQAQTINVLHSFTGYGDGSAPTAGVTLDRAGNLYGTTSEFDFDGPGNVYKLSQAGSGWILNTLYSFNHPNDPTKIYAGVVFGPDCALYGTGYDGGENTLGAVFSLRPPANACKSVSCPWTLTTLYSFNFGNDGIHPYRGNLVFDSAGNIYGTTYSGGTFVRGTVFKLTRTSNGWSESLLYSFSGGNDGEFPENGVTFDNAGNLYGTTSAGGNGYGTVFELSPSAGGWTETTLYSFTDGDDGANPIGGVAIDPQGNLYGTASQGGTGAGTVWELSPSSGGWMFALVHSFSGGDNSGTSSYADARCGRKHLRDLREQRQPLRSCVRSHACEWWVDLHLVRFQRKRRRFAVQQRDPGCQRQPLWYCLLRRRRLRLRRGLGDHAVRQ
jgi:uncharacterized repeat protein (TIGR03803 family)